METWKAFEANELTHSAAHHLVAVYEVGLQYGGWARVSDIARRLDITRGSVSVNLRALKKRGWIETGEHHQVKLTAKGLRAAQAVMAKRVVLKAFLTEVLGAQESQAEIDSCKVEHLVSDSTAHRLIRFMRFLSSGDPLVADLLRKFRRFDEPCTASHTCELCKGHCLADELERAI